MRDRNIAIVVTAFAQLGVNFEDVAGGNRILALPKEHRRVTHEHPHFLPWRYER